MRDLIYMSRDPIGHVIREAEEESRARRNRTIGGILIFVGAVAILGIVLAVLNSPPPPAPLKTVELVLPVQEDGNYLRHTDLSDNCRPVFRVYEDGSTMSGIECRFDL